MRYALLHCLLLLSSAGLLAQAPTFQQPIYNTAGTANNEIFAVTHDAAGNTYFAGRHSDTVTIGGVTLLPGSGGAYFGKANSSVLWAKQGGCANTSGDVAYGVAVDQGGNVYVCGALTSFQVASFNGTSLGSMYPGFVAKYDNDGNFLWAAGHGLAVYAIAIDRSNVPVINLGDGSIYKLDPANGALVETSSGTISGSNQNPFNHNICIDDSNNIIAQAGNKIAKFASDFTPVWNTPVSSSLVETFRINLDGNGNVYGTFYGLFGTVTVGTVTKSSFPNGYVYKLDAATGAPLFVDSILIGGNASKIKEVIPFNGDYYVMGDGAFNTPVVLRMTPAYSVLWQKNLSNKAPVTDTDVRGTDCVTLGGKHNGTAVFDSYTLTLPNGATSITNSYIAQLCDGTSDVSDPSEQPRQTSVSASVSPSARYLTLTNADAAPYEVYNVLGQRLDIGTISGTRYDISRFPSGIYFFVLRPQGGGTLVSKFVRQ